MNKQEEKPLTRKDLLSLVAKNDGTTEGLDLSGFKRFEDGVDLSGLELSGINFHNVYLFRASFNGSNLDRAIFHKANLSYATFNPLNGKKVSLKGAEFAEAHLNNAQFKEADLNAAQFVGEHLPAYLDNTDFRGAELFLANFKGCYFYGTKLEGAFIRGSDITEAHLGDADWGSYIIGEETKEEELYFAETRYRHLKMWYQNSGYYDIAAKFYYREREADRKQRKWKSRNWNHRLAAEATRLLFGYGEDWKRVLYWMVLVILGSSLAYSMLGGLDFTDSLYFSTVSFTALGYASWVSIEPDGWVKALGAVESFLGVFMTALLLVTFVRKWTR